MMNLELQVVLGALLAITVAPQAATSNKDASKEQSAFSAEEETVEHPVPIPADVMKILMQDEIVVNTLEDQHLSPDQIPESWFPASEVHLDGSDEKDLVVIGVGALRGAHIVSFWVFRRSQGAELLLAHRADVLQITRRRSHGYRDIEVTSLTAGRAHTMVFKFDGKRYHLFASRDQKL